MAGFTGDAPKIPTFVALKSIKDKPALAAQLRAWTELPGLNRVIVSHGEIVSHDAPRLLRQLADALAD